MSKNNILNKEFVRLPCSACTSILPSFTIKYPKNSKYKIIKDVQCRACQKIIRITISSSQTPNNLESIIHIPNNYFCNNLSSLDWCKYDPTDELTI